MTLSATSSDIRAANRRRVLHTVYRQKEISRQGLSQALSMSLPTVTQNLKEIEAFGLIKRQGLYESTGGRKAHIYHFVSRARIAIGVVLLKDLYRCGSLLNCFEIQGVFGSVFTDRCLFSKSGKRNPKVCP